MGNDDEPWHGTLGGYTNHRCRCDACRAANARHFREAKARRSREIPAHVHGTPNGYGNYKCRCAACTTAWAEVTLERRHRREAKADGAAPS